MTEIKKKVKRSTKLSITKKVKNVKKDVLHSRDVKPVNKMIVVGVYKGAKLSESGVHVGEANEFKSSRGKNGEYEVKNYTGQVISVANDCKKVKVGDTVVFNQLAGIKVNVSDIESLEVIDEESVIMGAKDKELTKGIYVLPHKLLVKLVKETVVKTASGIVITEKKDESKIHMMTNRCEVIKVGLDVEGYIGIVGDIVHIPYKTGTDIAEIKSDTHDYRLIHKGAVKFKTDK